MKRVILIVALAILLVAGCAEQQMTGWMMSGADIDSTSNEFVGRGGIYKEGIEVFVQADWIGVHGEEQWYGAGTAIDLPVDPNIIGQPYIGYQVSIAEADVQKGGLHGPIAGTKYPIAKNADFAVEGWYRTFRGEMKDQPVADDQWKAIAGLRIKF